MDKIKISTKKPIGKDPETGNMLFRVVEQEVTPELYAMLQKTVSDYKANGRIHPHLIGFRRVEDNTSKSEVKPTQKPEKVV